MITDAWAVSTEQTVLDHAVRLAPELGWNATLVARSAEAAGLSAADAELLLPEGARDLAALLSRRHDARALAALAETDPLSLKVRERIAQGVSARLEAAAEDADASRRCAAFLALPPNIALGLRLAWESADSIWRWAGDAATDENHYSKRAILSGILVPAAALRLSKGRDEAEAFVAARIENVMAFEKWKAGIKPSETAAAVARELGRLRYGRP